MNKNRELQLKILILILLLLLVLITSFRSGTKYYLIKHTLFGANKQSVESNVARWNFSARIIYENEVIADEEF